MLQSTKLVLIVWLLVLFLMPMSTMSSVVGTGALVYFVVLILSPRTIESLGMNNKTYTRILYKMKPVGGVYNRNSPPMSAGNTKPEFYTGVNPAAMS